MDKTLVGSIIAGKRKEKGLTQKQLADMLSVSNKTVSKWETGEGFPDITILEALARALDITVDELLGGGSINTENQKGDSPECVQYLAGKVILRFKNACVISCVFSFFGILVYWILQHEIHSMLSLLAGCAFGLAGGCIVLIGYNTLQVQIKKFGGLFPEKKKNLSETKKYLEKAVCGWILFVWAAVDFTIANRYGNHYELVRLFAGGFLYGCVCICLNSRLKKQIKM